MPTMSISGFLPSSSYRSEEQGHDLPLRHEEHGGGESDAGGQEEDDAHSLGRPGTEIYFGGCKIQLVFPSLEILR